MSCSFFFALSHLETLIAERIKLPLLCYQLFALRRSNVEEPSRNVLIHRARPKPRPKVRTSFAFQPVVSRRWQQMEVVAKSSPRRRFTIDHVVNNDRVADLPRKKKKENIHKLRWNIMIGKFFQVSSFFLGIFL